ncbi:MAG TPA: hypothetical protein VIE41_02755 [Methylomirabilota bacterium]|jgi:hypothetical protein
MSSVSPVIQPESSAAGTPPPPRCPGVQTPDEVAGLVRATEGELLAGATVG